MANDSYRIYLAACVALAKTMVIKAEASALANNKYLEDYLGQTISSDKTTWRYYKNISGTYHSTDRMMRVKSVDTYEMIDFTVDNLAIHRATAREYVYGTHYYKQLLAEFPEQELLILGILNPVDINVAIAAQENEILWMDPELVESNELSLKEQIQDGIYAITDRWHVEDYSKIESLYDHARYAILFANLPSIILMARLANCRSIYAHSYHIRSFLASHGRLDQYMDSMTKKQQLFFYRNLPYLNRNPGQINIFKWLIDNVLVERNFPLARYAMVHNTEDMPSELTPSIELIRTEMTPDYAGIPATVFSVEEVLEKEVTLARGNALRVSERAVEIEDAMVLSKTAVVDTKVLDSKVTDRSDSQIFTLASTMLNHWLYLAGTDRYRAIIRVTNPRSGEELNIGALDGFLLFLYCYNKSMDMDLVLIPELSAIRVRRMPKPTIPQLMEKVSTKYISQALATQIYDLATPVDAYISTASFNEAIAAVYRSSMDQFRLASSQGNHQTRGMAEAIMEGMYTSIGVEVGAGTSYSVWLKERGLSEVETFGIFEYESLANELLEVATGMDLQVNVSLGDIHRDMISIMSRMSSYSIQFVREINTTPLKPIPIRFIRPGESSGEEESLSQIDIHKLKLIRAFGEESGHSDTHNSVMVSGKRLGAESANTEAFENGLGFFRSGYTEHLGRSELPMLRIKAPVAQPLVDLASIMTVDHSDIVVRPSDVPLIDLEVVLPITMLDGLRSPHGEGIPLSTYIAVGDIEGFLPNH